MISIIIPVYNCENYIERCVKSIIYQKHQGINLEIILVDDGSIDRSLEVCQMMKSHYPNDIVVLHKDNGGVSSARNVGIDVANGEYIFFADADDIVTEDSLKKLFKQTPSKAQLYMGEVWIYGKRRQILYSKKSSYLKNEFIYELLTEGPTELLASGVWGKLFLSEIIKKNNIRFDEKYQNGEDGLFFANYLQHVERVEILEGELPVYKLYRYDKDERESAVSYYYPDLYRFFMLHREMLVMQLKSLDEKYMRDIYQHFINDLIVLLVRAYAFADFFPKEELHNDLKKIVNKEIVRKAIEVYKRPGKGTSIWIPFAIKKKNVFMLEFELLRRGRKYRKNRYDGQKLKSIYR